MSRVVSFHTWTIHCHPRIVVGGEDGFWSAFGCSAAKPNGTREFSRRGAGTFRALGNFGDFAGAVASWPQWIQPLNGRGNSALPSPPVWRWLFVPSLVMPVCQAAHWMKEHLRSRASSISLMRFPAFFSISLCFMVLSCDPFQLQPHHVNLCIRIRLQYCLSKHPITSLSRVLTSPFAT
jgi:hypothetical protein